MKPSIFNLPLFAFALLQFTLISPATAQDEQDQGTIGGTGVYPEDLDVIHNTPDIPERISVPDIPDITQDIEVDAIDDLSDLHELGADAPAVDVPTDIGDSVPAAAEAPE